MIKRQLWSSGHRINKPDKWVEDSSFEVQEPCSECLEAEKYSIGKQNDISLRNSNS